MKPDLAHLHLMAQQHAVASAAMGQGGFFPTYPPMSSTSPPPGMMHSPVSSMGSPGMLLTIYDIDLSLSVTQV